MHQYVPTGFECLFLKTVNKQKQDFKKTEHAKRIIYVLEILTGTLHLCSLKMFETKYPKEPKCIDSTWL